MTLCGQVSNIPADYKSKPTALQSLIAEPQRLQHAVTSLLYTISIVPTFFLFFPNVDLLGYYDPMI